MTETDRRRDKPINKRHMHCYRRAIYDTLVEMKFFQPEKCSRFACFHSKMINLIP